MSPFSRSDYKEVVEDTKKIKAVLKQIKIAQQPNIEEILVLDQKIDKIKNHESIDINIFFDQVKIAQNKIELDNWQNFIEKYVELNIKNEQIIQDCINNSNLSAQSKTNTINSLSKASYNFSQLMQSSFEIQQKMIMEFRKFAEIAERNLGKAEIMTDSRIKLPYLLDVDLMKTIASNIEQYNQQLAKLAKKYNIDPNLSN